MLIVYILILVLLIANFKSFSGIFFKNGFNSKGNGYLSLNTFVEPIMRTFNAFTYKEFNSIHDIK